MAKKFLRVPDLSAAAAPPVCFSSSAMMEDLSALVKVGACRIGDSLMSFLKTVFRAERALAMESRVDCLTAAVY